MIKSIEITERLEKYISDHSYDLNPIQKEIINYNKKLGETEKLQISITQGYFLQFLIRTNKIKDILEIGTFTGYSALSMGLFIPKDGKITCLDKNIETSEIARSFFKKANLDKNIKIITFPANEILPKLIDEKKYFDLIFIDADKENYKNYYDLSLNLVRDNGFIVFDNVLWKGDVVDPFKNDPLTKTIKDFNLYIKKDDRIKKTILPLGDGLTICRKL